VSQLQDSLLPARAGPFVVNRLIASKYCRRWDQFLSSGIPLRPNPRRRNRLKPVPAQLVVIAEPAVENTLLTSVPRLFKIVMPATLMRKTTSAYSTRSWPSSSDHSLRKVFIMIYLSLDKELFFSHIARFSR